MSKGMLILAAACAIALLLAGGKLLLTNGSFSPGNPYWDGVSALALGGRAVPIGDFGQLRQAGPSDTLLVVGPSTGFSAKDARDVSRFVLDGGRAIVMDDYGTAEALLERLDAPIAIGRTPLCQDVDFYRSPALPLVSGIGADDVTRNVSVLAFNHPVPLALSGDATPLAVTSARAWLDYDDNATFDGNETLGNYTLIARAGYGKGELIVAGDADLLINSMLKKGDNRALLDNIMEGGTVYLDVGHGQPVPPMASLFFAIKYDLFAQIVCVVAILTFTMACARLARPRPGKKVAVNPREEAKRSLIAAMKSQLPLSEKDIEALNKKL